MDAVVVVLVLAAALMHAVWNTLVKIGDDRLMAMAMVIGFNALLAPVLIFAAPAPAPASWIFIAISVVIHSAYFYFLIAAYRVGDLSHAYPLARGSAPLMVAAGAAVFADETLGAVELAGIVVISAGIVSLIVGGGRIGGDWRIVVYPLATGISIAAYTVADGLGVRLSGNPASYIGWLFVFSAVPIVVFALARRRAAFFTGIRKGWKPGVLGSLLAFCAYALVIWALSLGAMAHVSALRETSVVIAALIGARILGEPFGRRRVLAACTVAVGVVMLNVAA